MLLLAAGFGLMGYNSYLMLYPFKTIEVYNQPVPVLTPQAGVGEVVQYDLSYCKFVNKTARITRQLIGKVENPDGYDVISVDDKAVTSNAPPGCAQIKSSIVVPAKTPPGRYYLQVTSAYEVNPQRTIEVTWRTQEFEVTRSQTSN